METLSHPTRTVVALILALLVGCGGDDNDENTRTEPESPLVKPASMDASRSNAYGNFTVLNYTGEPMVLGTSASFENNDGDYWKLTQTSTTLSLWPYASGSDTVRFYAIRQSELEAVRRGHLSLDQAALSRSPLFIPESGGTWNPWGLTFGEDNTLMGELSICNHSDRIIGITVGDPLNQLEGLVNRGTCNVPLKLPADGLMTVYALDMETLEVVREKEVGLSANTRAELVIGKAHEPAQPAYIRIVERTGRHYTIEDAITGSKLLNNNCNNCTTLIADSTGNFTVPAYMEVQLAAVPTSGAEGTTSPVLALAEGETRTFLLENDMEGGVTWREVDYSGCESLQDYYGIYSQSLCY